MSKFCKTREEARQYFADSGLSYEKLKPQDITLLIQMLEAKLLEHYLSGELTAKEMRLSVSRPLKKYTKFNKNGLVYAFIKVDGSYFSNREGISFNADKFIGFCGEFDTYNTRPILQAFYRWCEYLNGVNAND